jgi:hypothetical protein
MDRMGRMETRTNRDCARACPSPSRPRGLCSNGACAAANRHRPPLFWSQSSERTFERHRHGARAREP